MKNTFLVLNDPKNPKSGLRVATLAEWDQILKANKELPREQRRFFIADSFEDCGEIDCMYIETTREEYNKWHSQKVESERKRRLGDDYCIYSLSEPVSDADEDMELIDVISNAFNTEKSVIDCLIVSELREELTAWNEWANELLDYYLAGRYSSCTKELVEKWKVSKAVVAKRKRQLNDFIKNFLL